MTKKRSIELMFTALGPSALLLLAAACGSSGPTKQLVSARGAYQQAEASAAPQLAPMRMQDARTALDAAERAHKNDPGSDHEANLAYVAERRSQIAVASGKLVLQLQEEQQLNAQYHAMLEQKTQNEQARLGAEEAMRLQPATPEPDPFAELRDIATIRQEPDGSTVITLSSAVLFPTNEDNLSPDARTRLNKVAQVLAAQPSGTQIRVEGFTDATGSVATNDALSQRRADAVRECLTHDGVDEAMLKSIGRGEAHPIASNDTEEGRAINRRAELVIKLPEGATLQKKVKPKPSSSAKTPAEKAPEGMSPENTMPKEPMAPQPPEIPEH